MISFKTFANNNLKITNNANLNIMKKVLVVIALVGAVSFSSCKKEELAKPEVKVKIAGGDDDKKPCHECGGGWD